MTSPTQTEQDLAVAQLQQDRNAFKKNALVKSSKQELSAHVNSLRCPLGQSEISEWSSEEASSANLFQIAPSIVLGRGFALGLN
jgi:hypothetical protein